MYCTIQIRCKYRNGGEQKVTGSVPTDVVPLSKALNPKVAPGDGPYNVQFILLWLKLPAELLLAC